MRTILTQLARLLVRIARRLDGEAIPAGAEVSHEHMADLRRRFPSAPRHWLEALARRGVRIEGRAPRPALQTEPPPAQADSTGHHERQARPPAARTRPSAPGPAFDPPHVEARPDRSETAQLQVRGRRSRPDVQFREGRSRPAFAEFKAIGRPSNDRRARFDAVAGRRTARPARLASAVVQVRLRDAGPSFAEPKARRPAPDVRFPAHADSHERPAPLFAESLDQRERQEPAWPNDERPAAAPDPGRFDEAPAVWPDLPSLLDESPLQPAIEGDADAEIRFEQVIGTWSA